MLRDFFEGLFITVILTGLWIPLSWIPPNIWSLLTAFYGSMALVWLVGRMDKNKPS